MIAVDASVLAYAVNRGVPEHLRAAAALEALAGDQAPWALPWSAVHHFVRLVTHPHAVVRPLEVADAWDFVEHLLAAPAVSAIGPTDRHARVAAEVLASLPGAGAVPAAFETAVLLREHGVRDVLSADRALRRFPFLSVRDPLHGAPWTPGEGPLRRYRVLRGSAP